MEEHMKSWFSSELGNNASAYEPTAQIQKAFKTLFMDTGFPQDMAIFSVNDLEKDMVTVYFTPSAHIIAKLFNACLCNKPSINGLDLLCGGPNCWNLLFPGEIRRKRV
jgi:hypothetical protein